MSDKLRSLLTRAVQCDGPPSSDYDLSDVDPPGDNLSDAAVLLAVTAYDAVPRVLLTKRSSKLRHHPGQVALPGGRVDTGETIEGAALREAAEEIGAPHTCVEIIGPLPAHRTVTSFSVTPILAVITHPFEIVAEPGEVEEVFEVPLAFLTDPANFLVEGRVWNGTKRHYYTVPYGPHYIWGATARILRGFSDRLDR